MGLLSVWFINPFRCKFWSKCCSVPGAEGFVIFGSVICASLMFISEIHNTQGCYQESLMFLVAEGIAHHRPLYLSLITKAFCASFEARIIFVALMHEAMCRSHSDGNLSQLWLSHNSAGIPNFPNERSCMNMHGIPLPLVSIRVRVPGSQNSIM
jgi:hypothetical protein